MPVPRSSGLLTEQIHESSDVLGRHLTQTREIGIHLRDVLGSAIPVLNRVSSLPEGDIPAQHLNRSG